MTMVVSRKQRIFFRYEGERGAFLLLHHGLLGSHEDWFAAGYVQELAQEFRVIVPDARGHGRSDKPAEKEYYGQLQMAEDLIEIMNELGIRNSHFVGYGLGALVGFELLRRFPERVRIAILGGESALMTPGVQDVYRAEAESLRAMSLADYLKALKDQGRIVRYAAAVDEEQERPAALALLEAIAGWEHAPAERIQVASPLTLFTGAEDPAAGRVEAARSGVSRARLVQFPGLGHGRLFQERTLLMEEVLRLLKSGRKDDESRARGEPGQAGGLAGRAPKPDGAQGQGRDRSRGHSGRRDGQSYGQRSTDRNPPGGQPSPASQAGYDPAIQLAAAASVEEPSPIPGAGMDGLPAAAAPETAREPDSLESGPASEPAPGSIEGDQTRASREAAFEAAPDLNSEDRPARDTAAEVEDAREGGEEPPRPEEEGWAAEPAPEDTAPSPENMSPQPDDTVPDDPHGNNPHGSVRHESGQAGDERPKD